MHAGGLGSAWAGAGGEGLLVGAFGQGCGAVVVGEVESAPQGLACGHARAGASERGTEFGERVGEFQARGGGFEDGDGLFE